MFRVKVFQRGVRSSAEDVIARQEFTIGRHPDNDLILRHDHVSRFHARVYLRDESAYIEDLGSHNGTCVGGREISRPTLVQWKDLVEIGVFTLHIEPVDEVTPSEPSENWTKRRVHEGHRQEPGRSWRPDDDNKATGYRGTTWYQVLGVPERSGADEVRRAYRTLVAQYHPDKCAHLGPELIAYAERKTRELNAAWEEFERLRRR
ncbi:MAG: FHA domain-containing protein [Myxococcales bacterium]